MERKSYEDMPCPVARSLEHVGEWWSILILRDAFYGLKRFDEFQKSLGIAPNMLTRRLKSLVDAGLLEKRSYSEHAKRYEYLLTARGKDFHPVLVALVEWGNKHFSPEGPIIQMADVETGKITTPRMFDKKTGKEMKYGNFKIVPGPAATLGVRKMIQESSFNDM
jgi:DNA-binding HxlR family transcriptional regulator